MSKYHYYNHNPSKIPWIFLFKYREYKPFSLKAQYEKLHPQKGFRENIPLTCSHINSTVVHVLCM